MERGENAMREVDERVVQMQLEHGAFDRAASLVIGTLDKIKNALNIGTSSKAFDDINASATNISGLDKMSNAIESISGRFTNLGIIGVTALQNITNKAIDTASQMLKSLTIAPISQGFEEYELKMGAVQTIMASTGRPLEEINGYLDELNTYADRTIYSFSDMTQNIGKFTNAGVDLKKAVKAIQGISNAAALSGSNAQQASHAMYNFAQAISSGSVKLIDWKSIELAGMATVEFKQQLIDTGLAMGTLVKEGDKYISTTTDMKGKVSEAFDATTLFNDSLSHQWMTTDVLVSTLNKYSDETTELGKRAFAAAQDVKTFSQLMDTLKEAVGSGWAQTFELIFGDFEEAKKLWTAISNGVGGFIDNVSKARNEMLQFWHDNGGRTKFFEGFANIVKGFVSVVKPIKDAWNALIPKVTGQDLVDLSKKFADVTSNMKLSEKAAEGLTAIIKILLIPVRGLIEAGKIAGKILGKGIGLVGRLAEGALEFAGNIAGAIQKGYEWISGLEVWERIIENVQKGINTFSLYIEDLRIVFGHMIEKLQESEVFQTLQKYIEKFQNKLGKLRDFIKNKFLDALESISKIDLNGIVKYLGDMTFNAIRFMASMGDLPIVQAAIKESTKWLKRLKKGAKEVLVIIKQFAGGLLTSVIDKFNELKNLDFGVIKEQFKKFVDKVQDYLGSLKGLSIGEKVLKIGRDALMILGGAFKWVADKLVYVKDLILGLPKAIGKFATDHGFLQEGTVLRDLYDFIVSISGAISDFGEKMEIGSKLSTFSNSLKDFASSVIDTLKNLDGSTILLFAFGVAVIFLISTLSFVAMQMANMLKSMTGLTNTIKEFIKGFRKTKGLEAKIKTLGAAVALIVASLVILSFLPTTELIKAAVALGIVLLALTGVGKIINKLAKEDKAFIGRFNKFAQAMLMMGGAMVALTLAFKMLAGERFNWNTMERLLIIADIALVLGGIGIMLSRYQKQMQKGSLYFVAFALSMGFVTRALLRLNGVNTDVVGEAVGYIAGLMLAFGALATLSSNLKADSGFGMILIALGIRIMASVVKKIIKIQPSLKEALGVLPFMAFLLLTTGSIMASTQLAGKNAVQGAVGMLLISFFYDRMIGVLEKIAKLHEKYNITQMLKMLATLMSVTVMLGYLMMSTYFAGKKAISGAVAVAVLSASTLLLANFLEKVAKIPEDDIFKSIAVLAAISIGASLMMLIMRSLDKVDAKAINSMTVSLGVLFAGIALMTLLDADKIIASTAGLASVLVSMGALMNAFGKLKIEQGISKILLMAVTLGSAATILNLMARGVDWKNLLAAGVSLGTFMVLLSTATKIAEKIGTSATLSLLNVCLMSSVAMVPLLVLAGQPWDGLIAAGFSLAIVMNALAAATRIATAIPKGGIGQMIAASLGWVISATALYFLAEQDWKGLLSGAIALSGIMFALAAATRIAQKNLGGAGTLVAMSFGVLVLAAALRVLKDVKPEVMVAGVISLALALLALGVATYALQGVAGEVLMIAGAFTIFGAGAWLFAQAAKTVCEALILFADVSREQAENIGTAFAVILLSFTISLIKGLPDIIDAVIWSGEQIVAGFLKGLLRGVEPIANTAKLIFAIPYGIITKIWNIKSPSRVAKDLGNFVGAGFEEGLLDSVLGITDASEMLGSSSLGGLAEGAEGAMSGMDSIFSKYLGSITNSLGDFSIGDELGSQMQNSFSGMFENLDSMFSGLDFTSKFESAFEGTFDIFEGGGLSAKLGLGEGLNGMDELFESIPQKFQESVSSFDFFGKGFDITSLFGDGAQAGTLGFSDIGANIKDNIFGFFTGEEAYQSGFDLMSLFKDGIKDAEEAGRASFDIPEFLKEYLSSEKVDPLSHDLHIKLADRTREILKNNSNIIEKDQTHVRAANELTEKFKEGYLRKEKLRELADNVNTTLTNRLIGKDAQKRFYLSGYMLNSNFVEVFHNAKDRYKMAADAMVDQTTNEAGGPTAQRKFRDSGTNDMIALSNGLTGRTWQAVAAMGSASTSIYGVLVQKQDNYRTVGSKYMNNLQSGMSSQWGNVSTTAESLAAEARSRFAVKERDYVDIASLSAANFSQTLKDNAWKASDAAGQVASSALSGISQNSWQYSSKGSTYGRSFADGVGSMVEAAYGAGAGVGIGVKNGINDNVQDASTIGVNIVQGLINGMQSKQKEVNDTAGSLASAADAAMRAALVISSPSKVTEKTGEHTGEGLEKGLENSLEKGTKSVVDAAKKLGQASKESIEKGAKKAAGSASNAGKITAKHLLNGMTQTLAINSPSKETEELGFYTVEGYIRGIQNAANNVTAEGFDVGNRAMTGLQMALKMGADSIHSEDVTPTITPVIDLTNVKSGMDTINTMMNQGAKLNLTPESLDIVQGTARSMRSNFSAQREELTTQFNNTEIVNAINSLSEDMYAIRDAILNMRVMLNGSALVGQILPGIDEGLAKRQNYYKRGN